MSGEEKISCLIECHSIDIAAFIRPVIGSLRTTELIKTYKVGTTETLEIEFARTLVKNIVQVVRIACSRVGTLTQDINITFAFVELSPLRCISASAALR